MVVDTRAGSGPLIPLLRARGVRGVEGGFLHAGDIEIIGNGPEGCPVSVGVEYKKLPDLVQSINTGRLVGHQLPAMYDTYEVVWLLVEGIWRENSDGIIEVRQGPAWRPMRSGKDTYTTASALEGLLMTLEHKVGVRVMRTGTTGQTVDWVSRLNHWWTSKEWEAHRAHLAFDNSQATALLQRPSLVRLVAKELPGIGMGRSGPVARHFDSVVEMVCAPASEWEKIEGIGKTTAQRVVRALEGEKV